MKRIIFDDIIQNTDYIVVQVRIVEGKSTPEVILATNDISKCRRLLWQVATDDHTRDDRWYRPSGAHSFEETYIQHRSGRIVRRYIPYKF